MLKISILSIQGQDPAELGIRYFLPYLLIAIPLLQCTICYRYSATFMNFAIRYSNFWSYRADVAQKTFFEEQKRERCNSL
jgi:hypothetical protein